jgi:hypothetical protein
MKKDITICFRTSDGLRNALDKVAREDRRSLSSVIELVLTDYLEKSGEYMKEHEKRRFTRKKVAFPAFIQGSSKEGEVHDAGVIVDISLGGLRVSLPKECTSKVYTDTEKAQFETSFVLPEENKSIKVTCRPNRVIPINGNIQVGASFVDVDFTNYQKLQQYLM